MMVCEKLCLPEGFMEVPTPEIFTLTAEETREVLGQKLPRIVDMYVDMLTNDSPHYKRTELARVSKEELKEHLRQLAELKTFLEEFGQNPSSFITRVQRVSREDNSYAARLKRAADAPFGDGIEHAQTQLSFHARIDESGEQRDMAISGASMKGIAPVRALKKADREVRGGNIILNTLRVFRSSGFGILVVPQAGIEIIKAGEFIDLNGLKPVGAHFHCYDIPNEDDISMRDYDVLRQLSMRLAGSHTT